MKNSKVMCVESEQMCLEKIIVFKYVLPKVFTLRKNTLKM